jgi:hypothetical protein
MVVDRVAVAGTAVRFDPDGAAFAERSGVAAEGVR